MRKAVKSTLAATTAGGDRKAGVIWHTQGSGKSLVMTFYAGQIIKHPAMQNPTLIVLTDRNDLDDQLFGTFGICKDLLRQTPHSLLHVCDIARSRMDFRFRCKSGHAADITGRKSAFL